MTKKQLDLCTQLKRLGFTPGNQMKLYGEAFEFLSDPLVMSDNLVLLDATNIKTGQMRRVRIPLPVVNMANGERNAA
jgi:hypothetical protein